MERREIIKGKECYERMKEASSTEDYRKLLQELSELELENTPSVEALRVKMESFDNLRDLVTWFTKNIDCIKAFSLIDEVYLHNVMNERLSVFGK